MLVTENIVLIDLGKQGEKDVTTVPIDYSPWVVEYGQGAVQAVYSTHLTDSVTMMTKEGFELRHEVFMHEPEPAEEADEAVEE